jgi:ribonuclease PH
MRGITFLTGYIRDEKASCLVKFGNTHVLVTATAINSVPTYVTEGGWITAEYGMLPRSSPQRIPRERKGISGRSTEIQRLIGRALRISCDLKKLPGITIIIDADVLQADGGTRTAAITGGFIVLYIKLKELLTNNIIEHFPIKRYVASISAGIKNGEIFLDLNYGEDSNVDVDLNLVMDEKGAIIEIQGTGERDVLSENQLIDMIKIMKNGISKIIKIQQDVLESNG